MIDTNENQNALATSVDKEDIDFQLSIPESKIEAAPAVSSAMTLDNELNIDASVLDATVMIVGDDELHIEVMVNFLQKFGYARIITASNNTSEIFNIAFNEQPDVILFEKTTFQHDELSLLRKIRTNKNTKQIPIIILTTTATQETKVQLFELGVIDIIIKPATSNELALRLRNILEVKNHHEHIASHDILTNLPNSNIFLSRLEWTLKYAKRYDTTGAILQLGLNRFKNLADSYGPRNSDTLLKKIADRINNVLRESDIVTRVVDESPARIASRSGGDEFSILLPVVTNAESAAIVAQKLISEITQPFQVNGKEILLSSNIGISIFPADGVNKEALLHGAIIALHQAKQDKLNNYAYYSKELNAAAIKKMDIINNVRKALKKNQFSMVYQPKMDLNTNKLVGAEALLRWDHPEYGLISPDEFIPLTEESGDIMSVGKWVIEEVCKQIRQWQSNALDVPRIAINISADQLKNNQIVEDIENALNNEKITAEQLDVEITESSIINRFNDSVKTLQRLQNMGIKISVDDFGTGYSSLSYLKYLPLNELKIDRSFIMDIGAEHNNNAIILAIITMAHSLGLNVVAEGVETKEQLNFLTENQCNIYQGYFFSPPISANKFSKMLEQKHN